MGAVCGAWFAGVFKHAKSGKSWWKLSQKWRNVSRRVKNAQGMAKNTELHHWFFQQNGRIGRHVPDAVKNHPWNLKPLPRDIHQRIHGNHPTLPQFDPIRRWWYGTPGWAKQAEGATAAGAAADAATSGSCECNN